MLDSYSTENRDPNLLLNVSPSLSFRCSLCIWLISIWKCGLDSTFLIPSTIHWWSARFGEVYILADRNVLVFEHLTTMHSLFVSSRMTKIFACRSVVISGLLFFFIFLFAFSLIFVNLIVCINFFFFYYGNTG